MTKPDALRLIAALAAYWRADVPDETAALWANTLVEYEVGDGLEAAELLGRSGRFFPSLRDFVDTIRDCRNTRLRNESRPALPEGPTEYMSFAEFLNRNPDWAERVKKLEARDISERKQPAPMTGILTKLLKEGA